MFSLARVFVLAVVVAGPCIASVSAAEPARVSGQVASKLEKQRVNVDGRYLPPRTAWNGTALLEYTVKPDGTVSDIKRAEGSQGCCIDPSIKALSQWLYNPYMVGDKPTAMRVTIQFKYTRENGLQITYL